MDSVTISGFQGTYFTSNVPDILIPVASPAAKARVTVTAGAELLLQETLWPVGGVVTLSEMGELLETVAQQQLVVNIEVRVQLLDANGGSTGQPTTTTATILYSRADVGIAAQEFYEGFFLSILMGTKVTAHGRLEYLHYYGTEAAQVAAEYDDGTTQTFAALRSGGTGAYTQLDVSPDYYEQADKQLIAYTVTAGSRSQRFEMDLEKPDCAPILEFYNSFGVWELIYCTGTHRVSPEYNRQSARIGGRLRNYKIDETRTFQADTGFLPRAMADWADELFRSDLVYVVNVIDGQLVDRNGGHEVILSDSKSERTNDDDHLARFTFSYQYAQRIHNVLQLNRVGRIFDNTFDHTFN